MRVTLAVYAKAKEPCLVSSNETIMSIPPVVADTKQTTLMPVIKRKIKPDSFFILTAIEVTMHWM